MKQKPTIRQQLLAQIAAVLPNAMQVALVSYQRFTATENEAPDAKTFKDHHVACKPAIAHVELLLKLADFLEAQEASGTAETLNYEAMHAMVQKAQAAVDEFRGKVDDTP